MSETSAHVVALLVAILGPLIVLILGLKQTLPPPGMYLYWATVLSFYITVLIPFIRKSWLTLLKLIFLGIPVEDFFSNLWFNLFLGKKLLPFCNWYTQNFPFIGSLGEPTPFILIPSWYLVAFLIYLAITVFQHRKEMKKLLKRIKKGKF